MLDRLTPAQRHGALLALVAALGWVSANVDVLGVPDAVRAVLVPVVAFALAWLTPLTRQYGVGSSDNEDE